MYQLKNMGMASFWAILLLTHLVTLHTFTYASGKGSKL
jgi:hypothetical protein